jgi:deoxyadenosine/deoxycytidine kinase
LRLAAIEKELGRNRSRRWGPRTIDLDLLLYGQRIIDFPGLVVPHPGMHLRSFVMEGLCRIAPDLVHPVLGESMRELASRLNGCSFAPDPKAARLVAVCGVIGVGKTTLAERLAKALDCRLILESYDDNPFLPDVHMGRTESALACQVHFLAERTAQLRAGSLEAGAPAVADYVFDKELIYAEMLLEKTHLSLYRRLYRQLAPAVAEPVLLIHLVDSAENCLDRIRTRGRPYERKIGLRLLRRMRRLYGRLAGEWDRCPVMRIDAGRFDCRRKDAVKRLARQVRCYTAGC